MKFKLLLLYFVFFNVIVFSQTNKEKNDILKETNVTELLKISNIKKKQAIEEKKLALSLAKANNWPIFIKDSTGGFSELIKIDSRGNPVYYTTYNYGAGLTARTNHLYSGGSLGLNIEGQNMIAGEWDGGAVLLTHELFEGRVTQMDGTSSTHYHSTHVAGTIIGTDQVQGRSARGMAFKANLHAYEWNNDQAEVAQAAASGLLISNHSYGYYPGSLSLDQFGKYNDVAHAFDDIMYNAPYYLFVAAAGNARNDGYNSSDNGYDLLSGHACSKNSMVVAAVHELTNYNGPSSVIMSYFSCWGPTDDGRIKPDISAKGVDTYSASDSSNSYYTTLSGTSMASPSVTGTLLLLQQYYHQLYGHFMHSSTLRGLALHTADEAGNNPGPDYEYGWGLINAKKAAEVIRDNGLVSYISEETLSQGGTYSISFNALGSEPLKATICWTDPAGTIITNTIEDFYSPALVNDLDIRITKNGTTYYPWKLDPNNPSAAATQGDNIVDNIEQVFVDNPVGTYTITVTHKGTLQSGAQNFSIIVSGISYNDFYITSSDVNQSICQGEDTAQFNLDLSTISGFSDTVNFSTINLPAGVNASFSPASLNAAGNFTLDLSNLSGLTAGVYPITIHGESSADTADLDVMLHVYDNAFPPQILNSPANNATSIPVDATFSWEENSNAQQYLIQIATDNTFTNIIEFASVSSTDYQATTLDNNTTYYWRIRPSNMCGDGPFSSTYSFNTVCIGPTNITTSNVTLDSVDVSWTENSGATSWEIEAVEAGSTPTGIGIPVNANPYTLTGLNSSTEYTIYVRSGCGSGNFSDWGVSPSFITASDYCNGDHFYDSGGPSGSYTNNEYSITTIAPSAGNNTITVTFNSFQLESGYDYLKVYNGSDTNAPLLGTFSGSSIPGPFTSDNPNGTLTFLFTSDGSVTYSGWDATVDCFFTSCPRPSNITSQNITDNSLDLSWIAGGTENEWKIEYGLTGFTQGSGTLVQTTSNPHTITGLNASTTYDFYVKAICGANPGDDDSLWVGPVSFTTLCGITTAPFIEDVESFNGDYEIENCWSANPLVSSYNYAWNISSNGYTPSLDTGPSQANSGSTFFFTEASNGSSGNIAELITPIIDISSLTVPQLSFYYHMYGADMGTLHVDVYNNGNWTNDVIILDGQQQTSGTSPWIEQTYVLNAFTGNVQIRFRGIKGNGYKSDMAIDDIKIIEAPSCPVPTNFTVDNITATTVDLSWVNGNTETNWEIEYGNSGFTQGTGTTVAVTTNPFTLSGLAPQTDYDVYLKAICGANPGDDDSLWVGPVSFTTHALASPHNLTADLDTTTGVVTLNWNQTAGFYEDFTDGIADNWVPVTGNWNVSNNTYNVTRTTHDVSSSYYNQDFSNFEFEMKAKKSTGDAYNISMFFNGDPSSIDSYGDWNNTYCLMYSTNGEWKLVKIINGNWTNIVDWTTSSAINTGYNWNIVKVEYVNGYINAYINNVLLGSYYDTTFPSGKIGIKIYDSNSNATNLGSFDYISLIDLSNTTNNYTFNVVEPNSFRNITSSGNCNNNENCNNNDIIGVETTPTPEFGNQYTYITSIPNAFLNYKIYRDGVEIGTSIPETYTDQLPAYGDYQYYVTSYYDVGESSPSNTVNVSWYGTPDIVVNPLTLSQTLYPNENATQLVTITNNGDDDLIFTINSTVVSTNSENIGYDNIETDNLNPCYVENSLENIMITPTYSKRTYYNVMNNLNILLYENTSDKNYYTDALIDLGYTYTQVSSWSQLTNTISNGTNWDLVIVNSYVEQCNSNDLTALDTYQSNGGFLIFSDWNVEDYFSHSLFSNFGISFLSNISTPINFSATDTSHPIFNIPNQINTFTWSDDQYYVDGQLVNLINGATQLAAFDGYPTNGAIVLNANQNCLFNAFQSDNFQHDDNNNGKDDIIELIENEIEYLVGGNRWLSTTQTSGIVVAGSSVTIDVNFDSTDMAVGTYNGTVAISSNDPDQPVVNVAAELIVIDNGGDVNELSQFDFKYYPNPFNKSINISANKNFDSVSVFSLLGQELINLIPDNKSQLTIDMSKFSVGTYYLKVVIDGNIASMKIIKK